jgi:hypothetical protein
MMKWDAQCQPERLKLEATDDRQAILFAGAGVSMTVGLPSWSKWDAQRQPDRPMIEAADA